MTDEKTPPKDPRKRATPKGKGAPKANGPGGRALSDRLWIAARALYESDLKISLGEVAKEFGVSRSVVERRNREERWQKKVDATESMTERAHKLADRAGRAIDEVSGPELNAGDEPAELEDETREKIQEEVTEETAVDMRAEVLERHRKEWAAPRKLSYEAIKERNFDRAKLAKITSETLKLIQEGERKAWGLDKGGDGEGVTVVIERD